FAVVTLVRDAGGEATHLSKWAGLGRRSPLVAPAMSHGAGPAGTTPARGLGAAVRPPACRLARHQYA
ncbi:hypothetical protein, partial [Streptomyces achromogenes]|uniref:hypothetical protein n=1 Tax=Streptomyces achromogenes TaxID=67255 RepID=UPI0034205684